jgi:spore germination protein D
MARFLFILLISFLLLTACNGESSSGNDTEYDATKKMVVDILQTEDGKKAIQDILTEEKMQEELVLDTEVVKDSINEALSSEKGMEMWKKLFEDPKFVESYAASMEEAQMELMKKLLNDSAYQEKVLELLKDPQMDDQYLTIIKSQEFRSHLEDTIQETIESPTYQAKIQEILLKAAEEQGGGEQSKGGSGEDGGGSQNGGGEDSENGGG